MAQYDLPYLDTSGAGGAEDVYNAAAGQDLARANAQINADRAAVAPRPIAPQVPRVNPTTGELWVNGMQFAADDARSALASTEYLNAPDQGKPAPAGFSPIAIEDYQAYIQSITDPSMGRLFNKNLQSGYQGLKEIGGAALSFAGAEETGGDIVKNAVAENAKLEPFQRSFTDIKTPGDFGEFLVANLGQVAPSIGEAVISAGVGALVGGPVGAGAGAVGSLTRGAGFAALKGMGREQARSVVLKALAQKQAGTLVKGSVEAQALKAVGKAGGAAIAAGANAYGMGIGDIYSEMLDQGKTDRLAAALGAIPYAAMELAPELAGLSALSRALKPGGLGSKASRLRRGAGGALAGIAAEGTTEAGQEAIIMGTTGQLGNEGTADRLINAFAAGAAAGGVIGGVGGTLGRKGGTTTPNGTEGQNASLMGNANPDLEERKNALQAAYIDDELAVRKLDLQEAANEQAGFDLQDAGWVADGEVDTELSRRKNLLQAEYDTGANQQQDLDIQEFVATQQAAAQQEQAVQRQAEMDAAYAQNQAPQTAMQLAMDQARQEQAAKQQQVDYAAAQAQAEAQKQDTVEAAYAQNRSDTAVTTAVDKTTKNRLKQMQAARTRAMPKKVKAASVVDPKLKITYAAYVPGVAGPVKFTAHAANAIHAMKQKIESLTALRDCLLG